MDEKLRQCILKGDKQSFKILIEKYQEIIFSIARNYLGNYAEAEEAVQEVWIKVFQKINQYDSSRAFEGWLIRIAINYCLDVLRKRNNRPCEVRLDTKVHQFSSQENPEEQELQDRQDTIEDAIRRLDDRYRELIILYYFENLSCREISEILGISETSVRVGLLRARACLRISLENLLPTQEI